MASIYDQIQTGTKKDGSPILRYRLNKQFVGADKVPEHLQKIITLDNMVDENGMVVVDHKNDEGRVPTEDNEQELGKKPDSATLPRVDQDAPAEGSDDEEVTLEDADDEGEGEDEDEDEDEDEAPAEVTDKPKKPAPVVAKPAAKPQRQRRAEPAPAPAKDLSASEPRFRSKVPQSNPGMGFPRKNGRTVDIFDLKTPHTKVKFVGGHAVPLSEESFRTRTDGEIISRIAELGKETVDFNRIEREQAMAGVANPSGLMMEEDNVEEDIQLG